MGASAAVAICLMVITLSPRNVNSQIPAVCADASSLQNMMCCPSNCGSDTGRGTCAAVDRPPDATSDDVRFNWPHYFQRVCQCSGNYSGYDCSRCKYGHYGPNCSMTQILPRRNILILSIPEFTEYIAILQNARSYDSGYVAVLNQLTPGSTNVQTAPLTLYQTFIWIHHFAAKDSECGG